MTLKQNHSMLPVFSLLVAATMWGVVWYPLRLLEEQGLHGLWASLIGYGVALLMGLIWLARSKAKWPGHPLAFSLMVLAVGWCNVAFVLAVLEGTVVRVMLLFYLSPLWALILGWLLLNEKPTRLSWLIFVVGLVGALIMLWDENIGFPWPRDRADWLAVSSGLAFSFSNVMMRYVGDVDIVYKANASWLGVVVIAALWILFAGIEWPSVSTATLSGAVLLGVFGFFVMSLVVIYGVTHMPVHRSAVILLFELVIGAVSSMLLTDEVILIREWVGGFLILFSSTLAAREHLDEGQAV
ncbi:MAG: DMT family transporter [Gammaproteobacteria bacterium]